MAERITRVLSELEASFEGSIELDDSLAAADLAASMRRDQRLYDRVLRWRGARLIEGPPHPVSVVAADHLVLGDPARCFVRAAAAALIPCPGEGGPIRRSDEPLSVALRSWVKDLVRVDVRLLTGSVVGRLKEVTPDHVLIEGASVVAIPYAGIRWISLCHEG